ncbi:hypothetical protein [Saccharolobus shibatae]|uniref:Uncharacterized protein n=1 Tax=Saccharolobus shibatae TaxID=2286 RepID=A0A8F5BVW0_9CREN|nr:hypothetical protein [Saccharolobus shibatae]QXJ32406.1 hypothetical protein J5U21_02057 [Saccharolobus shibatae]
MKSQWIRESPSNRVDETIDAISALKLVKDRDFETVKAVLRATMIKDFAVNEDKQERRQEIENKYSVLGRVTDRPFLANELYKNKGFKGDEKPHLLR